LDQLLLEFRSGLPAVGLDSWNVVLADTEIVSQLTLGQAVFLAHGLKAGGADLDLHDGIVGSMLTVILGAGASYDSDPADPPAPDRTRHKRPPLSNQLFADRFGYAVDRYRACRPLIHDLRHLPAGASIEEELDRITQKAEAGRGDLRLRRQLMAIRYYLADVVSRSTREWSAEFYGVTNYSILVNRLDAWATSAGERILWVDFNYDSLLEEGLRDVTGFRDDELANYVGSLERHVVVKPHGSANWVHLANDDDPQINYNGSGEWISQLVVDRLPHITIGSEFVVGNWLNANGRPAVPAITIPIREKVAFECPTGQFNALVNGLGQTNRLLVIGWAANEENFLALCRQNLKGPYRVQIVCGGVKQAHETSDKLQSRLVRGQHLPSDKGFSDFLASQELDWLLSEDPALGKPRAI
jgi:hypothetical protein